MTAAQIDTRPTLSELTAEYQMWTAANGYPEEGSADELLAQVWSDYHAQQERATASQLAARWLTNFIVRWEAALESDDAFTAWTRARVWCADFAAAGLPHALDAIDRDEDHGQPLSGYAYPAGAWIVDAKDGTYWTIADRGQMQGTLTECERFLWDHHAKHELANG